jgi:hypothetical protein
MRNSVGGVVPASIMLACRILCRKTTSAAADKPQQSVVPLRAVTRFARGHDVSVLVAAAPRQRLDVIARKRHARAQTIRACVPERLPNLVPFCGRHAGRTTIQETGAALLMPRGMVSGRYSLGVGFAHALADLFASFGAVSSCPCEKSLTVAARPFRCAQTAPVRECSRRVRLSAPLVIDDIRARLAQPVVVVGALGMTRSRSKARTHTK